MEEDEDIKKKVENEKNYDEFSIEDLLDEIYNLKKQLSNEIDEATKKLMSSHVPLAVDKLKELISNPKISPSVQLGAVNSLLDRSGYQTITKIEDVTGRKTDAELREELRHLLGTIAVVKPPFDSNGSNGSGSLQ